MHQVQSVLRSFLAKVCLVAAAEEAEAAAAAAAAAEAAAAAAKAQAGACVAAVLRRFQARQQLQAAAAAFAVKEEAARLLQSAVLRFGAQALLLQLGAEDAALREAAALRLQSAQRTHSAQRELARRKARRDGLLLLSPGKHRAVRQLQKCCRRYLAQCTLRAAEHRRSRAAAQVQALWRAHRCRLQLAETLREWRDGRAQARTLSTFGLAQVAKWPHGARPWPALPAGRFRLMQSCSELLRGSRERAARGKLLSLVSDDERHLILSFLLGDLACYAAMAALDKALSVAVRCPGAWQHTTIRIPRTAELRNLLDLAGSWALAREAVLPAFPKRRALQQRLEQRCPQLQMSLQGEGPFMLFVMGCSLPVGSGMPLHFFEPRYRWMCRRLFATSPPHVFGFVTGGRAREGVEGVLCEVRDLSVNHNGTYDVFVVAKSSFVLSEVWLEELPYGAPLAVGFVERRQEVKTSRGARISGAAWLRRLAKRLCCPRRG
ncbi:unnamed protein product [Effrenium voratum]|uniref:Uncharacterized protein n=1 Tax=Effrenium voratum TaxID=2562239 RepID=A0AA36IGA4_9DINO|nr:unnamed protein product [Effrenium voratum]